MYEAHNKGYDDNLYNNSWNNPYKVKSADFSEYNRGYQNAILAKAIVRKKLEGFVPNCAADQFCKGAGTVWSNKLSGYTCKQHKNN